MKRKAHTVPAYPVVIEYSQPDGGYIARAPALKYCSAFGETYEEAAREIAVAMRLWLDSARAHGQEIPPPGAAIEELQGAADLLNLGEIARRMGIPKQTLYAKVRRGSQLKPEEALAVARALNEAGLHLVAKAG
ncbi:MAG: type II toxin-antitoxin system HicB family antitoxin [Opitutaceae bacterium]